MNPKNKKQKATDLKIGKTPTHIVELHEAIEVLRSDLWSANYTTKEKFNYWKI